MAVTSWIRRQFKNGVSTTDTLNGQISAGATTFALQSGSSFPDGSVGPFIVTLDPGQSAEEKVLVQSRTGATFTVAAGGRGYNNTTAQIHLSGAAAYHTIDQQDLDEANQVAVQTLGAIAASGDLLQGSAANTLARLARGSNGQVLMAGASSLQWSGAYVPRLGGTAAAASTLPFFNAKDWGCKLDNATDDTTNLQAAITAVSAAGGGTLGIPGIAFVNTQTAAPTGGLPYGLSIPSNVELLGWGTPGTCGIRYGVAATGTGTNALLQNANPNTVGNTNISIRNLFIQCVAPTGASPNLSTYSFGVAFNGCTNVRIIGNAFTYAMVQAKPLTSVANTATVNANGLNHQWLVDGNVFQTCASGMGFYQGVGWTFTNNQVLNAYDSSVSVNSSGEQIVIAGNVIDKQGNTWASLAQIEFTNDGAGDSNGIRDVAVSGNVLLNAANTSGTKGVQFQGVTHGSVNGNTIRNVTGVNVYIADGSVAVAVSGNDIDVPAAGAQAIEIANDVTSTDIAIIGNTIKHASTTQNAVSTGGGAATLARILIADNQINATVNNAIRMDAAVTNGYVVNNNVGGSAGTINQGAGTGWVYRNNNGYNPVGSLTVAVPASGSSVASAQIDRMFYIQAAGTSVAIAIQSGPTVNVPANTMVPVRLAAGLTFTPTYTNAPAWVVEGE